jgi:putative endonuclease
MKKWFVYILECGDGSLYTGSTNDLEKRVKAHNAGKGAKYTRSHLPVKLVYFEEFEDLEGSTGKSLAMKREVEIKKLSRREKLKLIKNLGLRLTNYQKILSLISSQQ